MIQNETEFLAAAKKRYGLREARLRAKRTPATDLDSQLLAECQIGYFDDELKTVQAAMDEYDGRVNADRKGTWMPMPHARFWPEDPRPQDIFIEDIAHGLARLCRFNGRIKYDHYSVAQHSVLVSRLLKARGFAPGLVLFGLMHDAGEAYLGDVITPIKRLFRHFYEEVEERVMRAVADRYNFRPYFDAERARTAVKWADTVMLATEARDVTLLGYVSQELTELPDDQPITDCWCPDVAQMLFLREFEGLTSGAGAIGG